MMGRGAGSGGAMVQWEMLIGEELLAAVLPGSYRRYLRPIRGALAVFLESLPEADQRDILLRQAALPAAATAAERLALLAQCCPVLHKLGQTLARDHRLSPAFRRRLQRLESLPPSVPLADIERLLGQELGPLDRLGITLEPRPLAEASVAVVVAYRQDAAAGAARHGVLKLLKPGIEERLERELSSLSRIGAYLDEQCAQLGIPHLDYQESLEQVRDKLRQEIRLDLEQHHLAHAAAIYRNDPEVHIPALLAPCTRRVTAMERIYGRKITAHGLGDPLEIRRLAELAVGALIARPLFASDPRAIFHGDPHAGNLFVTDEGRLAILDWSLAASLTEHQRVLLVQIVLGAMMLEPGRVVEAMAGLAQRGRVDRARLASIVEAGLTRVRQGAFPGLTWLVGLLDEAIRTAGLRVAADLVLFRRAFHALEGVLADLGAAGSAADWALWREFAGALAREWPARWLAPAGSRAFATRVSNVDLAELLAGLPWSAAQMWLDWSGGGRSCPWFPPGLTSYTTANHC